MKTIEITSESITDATVVEEECATPKKHYFYAYQYSMNGQWFSGMLYNTPQEAHKAMNDPIIMHKKLCCVVL